MEQKIFFFIKNIREASLIAKQEIFFLVDQKINFFMKNLVFHFELITFILNRKEKQKSNLSEITNSLSISANKVSLLTNLRKGSHNQKRRLNKKTIEIPYLPKFLLISSLESGKLQLFAANKLKIQTSLCMTGFEFLDSERLHSVYSIFLNPFKVLDFLFFKKKMIFDLIKQRFFFFKEISLTNSRYQKQLQEVEQLIYNF